MTTDSNNKELIQYSADKSSKMITSEHFVSYMQCPRKAFLLYNSTEKGKYHDYSILLARRREELRKKYLKNIIQKYSKVVEYNNSLDIFKNNELVVNVELTFEDMQAYCATVVREKPKPTKLKENYLPAILSSTNYVTTESKNELLFSGFMLSQIHKHQVDSGKIIGLDGKAHRIKLEDNYKKVTKVLKVLRTWLDSSDYTDKPSLILNKHCLMCQFQEVCRKEAMKEENLTLLNRLTEKLLKKYNKRGIFTVTQLSYLFKPRKKRYRKDVELIKHSFELQALAIRNQKIYIEKMPDIPRKSLEIFLDIEGIPDEHFYYLFGLLICKDGTCKYYSFIAKNKFEEEEAWIQMLSVLKKYHEPYIYHYGNYEKKAFSQLSSRYNSDISTFEERLVNVNTLIFGKVYFPIYSNSLKEIGKFLGAKWTSKNASGLQSLVWYDEWERSKDKLFIDKLIEYNQEDCLALKIVVDKLADLREQVKSSDAIEMAFQAKKLTIKSTSLLHKNIESIIKLSHFDNKKDRLSIVEAIDSNPSQNKRGAKLNHAPNLRKIPKPDKLVNVFAPLVCPKCQLPLVELKGTKEKVIIDLKITKNGFQKKIIKYYGFKKRCTNCCENFNPPQIDKLGNKLFSRTFQAWIINQRVALRLPYHIIRDEISDFFCENIVGGTLVNYIKSFSEIYASTEKIHQSKILLSPCIHADETQINIAGINHYVWVFTNGKNVIFRISETRESHILHSVLHHYKGVVVSDFYAAYDSLNCMQQKCWVHLLRDINDDLLKNPFDKEYEEFTRHIQELITPMFDTVNKYGLKCWHLKKYKKIVSNFYKQKIDDVDYSSDLSLKYQKRFIRYRNSLFTFLEHDSVPWHNNTAERALRHITVQEKISGSFSKIGATAHLILLGIMQTCRFQDKSFFKFLISEEKDVDKFKKSKVKP